MLTLTGRALRFSIAALVGALLLVPPLVNGIDGDHAPACSSIGHARTHTAPAKIKLKPLALDAGGRLAAAPVDRCARTWARLDAFDSSPRECDADRSPESRRGPPA